MKRCNSLSFNTIKRDDSAFKNMSHLLDFKKGGGHLYDLFRAVTEFSLQFYITSRQAERKAGRKCGRGGRQR